MEPEVPEDSAMPAVVVYLIDPFSYSQEWSELHRLAMLGLLRCYQQMVLPPHLQNSTFLQVRRRGSLVLLLSPHLQNSTFLQVRRRGSLVLFLQVRRRGSLVLSLQVRRRGSLVLLL